MRTQSLLLKEENPVNSCPTDNFIYYKTEERLPDISIDFSKSDFKIFQGKLPKRFKRDSKCSNLKFQ